MVHLAYETPSPTVRIYLRDCCVADFDGELQVHFGATPDLADARLCQQLRNLGAGTDVDVACDGQGKYVFVSSFGWMAFAEVEVTGVPDLPANNDDGSCVYATAACPADAPEMDPASNATCVANTTCVTFDGTTPTCVCDPGLTGTGKAMPTGAECPPVPPSNGTNSSAYEGSTSGSGSWSDSASDSDSESWSGEEDAYDDSCRFGHAGVEDPWCSFVAHGCVPAVSGCTETCGLNYDSAATVDDGSCVFCTPSGKFCYLNRHVYGCTDPESSNFNKHATREVRFLTEIVDDFRRFVDEIWRF